MPYATTDMTQIMGIGSYVGEVRQGPDGQLYEWVEGVDGLGNPIGFWRRLKRLGKRFARVARPLIRRALPLAKFIPGYGQAITAAEEMARKAGVLGIGEIAEGPDGQLYEVVEGTGAFGEQQAFRSPVSITIPASIRTGAPIRRGVRPGIPRRRVVRGVRRSVPARRVRASR